MFFGAKLGAASDRGIGPVFPMSTTSRRNFIASAVSGLGLLPLASLADLAGASGPALPLKIVCVGAHPDDPESGCGGTLLRLRAAGHSITVIYLTRGEAGVAHCGHAAAAAIRTKEAEAACEILQAKPIFAGQVDGASVYDNGELEKMRHLLAVEKPDVVFTHWPLDSHKDHQVASLLTVQSWMNTEDKFTVYFYEVCTGDQSVTFRPTDYVDIGSVQETKKRAVYCHASQKPAEIYGSYGQHALMERFRGLENGVTAAEAFVRLVGKKSTGVV